MSYINYSHSLNYEMAYKEGKRTLSQISKRTGIPTTLLKHFLKPCEWHHTSKYYNVTWMYDLNDEENEVSFNFLLKYKKELEFLNDYQTSVYGWACDIVYNMKFEDNPDIIIEEIKKTFNTFCYKTKKAIKPVYCEELGKTKNKFVVYLCLFEDGTLTIGTSKTSKGNKWDTINISSIRSVEDLEKFINKSFYAPKYLISNIFNEIQNKLKQKED